MSDWRGSRFFLSEITLFDGLQGSAVVVVEGVVQEEDVGGAEFEAGELASQLFKGVRAETAGDERAEVVAAQIDLDRSFGVKRKRHVANGAEVIADGATAIQNPLDDRFRFARCKQLKTLRTIRFAADAIPIAGAIAAAGTGEPGGNRTRDCESQAFHSSPRN